ncbi:MAG: tryptophan-rich sensory protein [Tatlockia sp.]|nr:tryptophan-rich sensory protein [Tatlockia sp.]
MSLNNFKKNKWGLAFLWVIIFQLVGFLLGKITNDTINSWYRSLEKSTLTPPDQVFAIVWTILYLMIALAGWSLWINRKKQGLNFLLILFFLQVGLNWLWIFLFFYFKAITLSIICIILLTMVTALLIIVCRKKTPFTLFMLIPYFLWLCFATYLNFVIYYLNI